MKYQFEILASDLQIVINAYKEVGGYLEIVPDVEGKVLSIVFDNIDLLATEGLKVLEHSCAPVCGSELWSIKKEVLNALYEFYATNNMSYCHNNEIIKKELLKVLDELRNDDNISSTNISSESTEVSIRFVNYSDGKRERIAIVNGKELFRDKHTIYQYAALNDPLRKLELWLFDMDLKGLNY